MKKKRKAPKKLLFLSEVEPSGGWIATQRLAKAYKRKNVRDRLFLLTSKKTSNAIDDFEKIIYTKRSKTQKPFGFIRELITNMLDLRNALKTFLHSEQIDYAITNDYLMMLSTLGLGNFRRIFLFHGIGRSIFLKFPDFNYRKVIEMLCEKTALFFSDIVVVPTTGTAAIIRKLTFHLLPRKKIKIVPNYVPEYYFRKPSKEYISKLAGRLKISRNTRIVLYSGRVELHKGLEKLIELFVDKADLKQKIMLLIAYPSSSSNKRLLRELKRTVRQNSMESRILFIRDLNPQGLVSIYSLSDLAVLPSDSEIAPLSVLESFAAGKPVIGTKTGNMREVISKIDRKLLLNDTSPRSISSAIDYYFNLSGIEKNRLKLRCLRVATGFNEETSAGIFTDLLTRQEK